MSGGNTMNQNHAGIHWIPKHITNKQVYSRYKMDYAEMLKAHKEKGADLTVAVLNVSMDEASRFGIMNTNDDLSIYEFEEKQEHPNSTLASMGIYIFTYKQLRKYLRADEKKKDSHHDFGMDIIPAMLADHKKLFAY